MAIKITMLLLFFAVMIAVGVACRRKAVDVNSFVLGGRSVGPWLTAFAYGTSYFSAVIFIGYAGQFGWKFGLAATWIGIGNAILGSLLPWLILGRRTRLMTQKLGSATMPDFFGKRFESPSLKIGASVIVFVFLIPYTASLYNGLSRLFEMAFGIDYVWCILIMSVLTCAYVVVGGYMASAVNNFIQGLVMLVGIVAVVIAVVNGRGGFFTAFDSLGAITDTGISEGSLASVLGPDPISLFGVIILTSLGTWGLPQMVGKFYSIKDGRSIRQGTVISTVFALVVAGGCYFLGGFGRLFDVDISKTGYDSVVPKMLEGLPDALLGLVVILVLSASMSTLSSLVMTSSSTLTLDLIKGHIVKNMKEKQQLLIMRVLIVFFIIVSAVIAIVQYKGSTTFIADLMGISWGALAGAFLAPYLLGLYSKKITKAGAWASFAFSSTLMIANMLFRPHFPKLLQSPINCGAIAMLAGFVIVIAVSAFTKKPDAKFVDEAFECLKKEK